MLLPLDTEGLGGWLELLEASIGLLSEACSQIKSICEERALRVCAGRVHPRTGSNHGSTSLLAYSLLPLLDLDMARPERMPQTLWSSLLMTSIFFLSVSISSALQPTMTSSGMEKSIFRPLKSCKSTTTARLLRAGACG